MNKSVCKLLNACCPLIIIFLIFLLFLNSTQCATLRQYTYDIESHGQTLVIKSGLNHVGEIITFKKGIINFQDNLFKYEVNNIKNNLCSVDFFLPDSNKFSINGFNLSTVNFHNNSKTIIHSESAKTNDNQQTDTREVLISSTIVHLRIVQLHNLLKNYLLIYIVLLFFGWWIYIKPNFINNFIRKAINKKCKISILGLRIIGLLIMVLSTLLPFTFLM